MKKLLAVLLIGLLILSSVACGKTSNGNSDGETTEAPTLAADATVGETLSESFKADNSGTAQEIADRLIANEIIEFMGATMPVEEGLLNGFDNAEIKGFEEGVMFGPAMSSIAFIGYIFKLSEDADVEAFKTTLKDSANLRWNICVEAEELIVENEGNTVFFLMCPKSFEQPEVDGGEMPGEMLPEEDMLPAEDGITLE